MKLCSAYQRNLAFTWVDLAMVVVVLLVLTALMLAPVLTAAKRRAQRINCASKLRQICIVYDIWQRDHNGQYPNSVLTTNEGVELIARGDVAAYFITMTDYISTPMILNCPADSRLEAHFMTPWVGDRNGLNNSNISYFVGLDANKTRPQTIISGDDNFAIGDGVHPHPPDNSAIGDIPVKSGLLDLSSNTPIWWTGDRHKYVGNVAFSDGHVQPTSGDELQRAVQETGIPTNRLAIP